MIAFYGMGLLGSGFVRALRKRGETVHVWNRSTEKATALEADGAQAFVNPAEAAKGAGQVHLTLSDDAAVDAVLECIRPGLAGGTVIVDHTTTSVKGARDRSAKWKDRGFEYLHAPVFMGPQNALEGTGVMMTSGDPGLVERLTPSLEKMTGKLVNLGPEAGRAASFKLMGNLFLMFFTGGLAEVLTLAKALDVKPEDAAELFGFFNPAHTLAPRLQRMIDHTYESPSWELSMARKDARLMIEAGYAGGAPLPMLPTIAATMDRFIDRGHGHHDWTVIAKDAVQPRAK